MITIRKLKNLTPRLRERKLLTLWKDWEHLGSGPGVLDPIQKDYFCELAGLTQEILSLEAVHREPDRKNVRLWRRTLFDRLGLSEEDWDFQTPPDRLEPSRTFPFVGFLEDLRSPFNVGSIFRTAEAYAWESLVLSPSTPSPFHPRAARSAMGTQNLVSWSQLDLAEWRALWADRPVFALELGGTPLDRFDFPADERGRIGTAAVLIGNEELGLSREALDWAEGSWGRLSLPLFGRKASLNVGVAFGILAAYWTSLAV